MCLLPIESRTVKIAAVGNCRSQPLFLTAIQSFMHDFPIQPSSPLTFIADAMLGRLARWLRILGYDTAYEKVIEDAALIARALREDRWLLTRDGYLAQRKVLRDRYTLITSDHVEGQLRQLHRDLQIDLSVNDQRGYRCADCNERLVALPYDEAVSQVPPRVAEEHRHFLQCPRCGRPYWPGTHWDDIRRRLARLADEPPAPDP